MQNFKVKTNVCFGEGALNVLSEQKGNVVIFTDAFMVSSGAAENIKSKLSSADSVKIFGEIKPDPPIELIAAGLGFLVDAKADCVVALGGGSSIDAAKATILMAKRSGFKDQIKLIAIPTTSGTGSEVTNFAVITDSNTHIKYPLVSDRLLPQIAILDPALVRSVPPRVTADTGMDVLTHAIEANVSTAATDFSDALAEKAIRLVRDYLPRAYHEGDDMEAREHMHNASCLAGVAFNHASLGINHSIAHVLGARLHIPHGRANAIVLPYVIEFNSHMYEKQFHADARAAKIYAHIGMIISPGNYTGQHAVRNLTLSIDRMNNEFGIPSTLRETGVDEKAFLDMVPEMAEIALQDKCTLTNPRAVSKPQMVELLKRIYYGR